MNRGFWRWLRRLKSWRKPRRFHPSNRERKLGLLESRLSEIWAAAEKEREKLSEDPVTFFEQVVGFKPTKYQRDLAEKFVNSQFTAMRWNRQSGKSWIASALLLNYALTHDGAYIGIVAPGWRQSKLVIRRIDFFLRKLPKEICPKPQRTVLYFSNGSIIEAFPNNPDTIRGPTLDVVYWDEANHTPDDVDLWTAILFTISATGGKVLASSTPWNTDSIFYKMCKSEEFSDFARSHVSWKQSMEPNGPLDKGTLDKIRKLFGEDPWRWKREMEAEWAEDETAWLSQALITKCIATEKTLGEELELWDFESIRKDCNLYAGLDLGRVKDYSVLVVIEKVKGKFYLRHVKIFPLGTSYASVIGYVKTLQDRWEGFCKIRVDSTNQDYVVEDMQKSEIDNVEGVRFSLPRKQEMATLLKQRMINNKFWFPYFTWERPYRGEFVTELNVERFELRKDGSIAFNHP
ncbi:MAG: terminase large subunit domain-containing protein, partial [Candidatus Bathyarchaeia archaeon]